MSIWEAFGAVFEPTTFAMMMIGCIGGILIGAIPGLSGSTGIILLLPLVYTLDMLPALVVMAGMFCGTMYGGAIPAVLIQTPGTPSAAATTLDGYPLAQQGKAGKAITIALVASVIGGLFSGVCLMILSPILAGWALQFQAPEYFALALFGLALIASSSNDLLKGLLSGFMGIFIGCIGVNVITGTQRFTFNSVFLMGGINVLPLLVGLFAISQVFLDVKEDRENLPMQQTKAKDYWLTKSEWKRIAMPVLVASIVGVVIGVVPGAGGGIACFLGYEAVKKFSKHPEEYGKGSIEGLAAAESANNATTGGALVPLITLGVPGDAVTAVMLGAFMLVGIRPGPLLFVNFANEMQMFFVAFIVMQIVILILGALGTSLFIKVLQIPKSILMPAVMLLCFLGAYALSNSINHALFALIFGVLGYFMKKYGFPAPPMILGLVLGSMAEQNLNRTLLIHQGNWGVLFTRPIAGVLMLVAILTILGSLWPVIKARFFKKEKKANA